MISHEDAERNSLEDGKLIESTILAAAMLAVCERRGVRALGVLTAQTEVQKLLQLYFVFVHFTIRGITVKAIQ